MKISATASVNPRPHTATYSVQHPDEGRVSIQFRTSLKTWGTLNTTTTLFVLTPTREARKSRHSARESVRACLGTRSCWAEYSKPSLSTLCLQRSSAHRSASQPQRYASMGCSSQRRLRVASGPSCAYGTYDAGSSRHQVTSRTHPRILPSLLG